MYIDVGGVISGFGKWRPIFWFLRRLVFSPSIWVWFGSFGRVLRSAYGRKWPWAFGQASLASSNCALFRYMQCNTVQCEAVLLLPCNLLQSVAIWGSISDAINTFGQFRFYPHFSCEQSFWNSDGEYVLVDCVAHKEGCSETVARLVVGHINH